MCGIFGYFNYNREISFSMIVDAFNLLEHRGPDDASFFVYNLQSKNFLHDKSKLFSKHLFFGHKRLSIVDLSPRGRQPMSFEYLDIIFNGEIYNYQDIKKELLNKGYSFSTKTDTEVLLKGFHYFGEKILNLLNGQWAFAILDRKNNNIFLSVDRFSIKQLYYYMAENIFIFASEIKPILKCVNSIEVNESEILDFLVWGPFEHTENTLFKGVKKLSSGAYIKVDLDTLKLQKKVYYNLNSKIKILKSQFDDNSSREKLYNLLFDAVKIRLEHSDVPVGVLLSGGVDSSIIAYFTKKIKQKEFTNFFSIYYDIDGYNELEYSALLAKKLDIKSYNFKLSIKDLLKYFTEVHITNESPIFGAAVISEWLLAKNIAMNTDVKVVLTGIGGDEIFGGYNGYYSFFYKNLVGNAEYWKLFKEFICRIKYKINSNTLLKDFILLSLPESFKRALYKRNFSRKYSFYKYLLGFNKTHINVLNIFTHISLLEKQIFDINRTFLPQLLHYSDRDFMHFAIEGRHPFLDHRIVEFGLSLPDDFKIHKGFNKFFLRKTFDGILPDRIIWRKNKKGLPSPDKFFIKQKKDKLFVDCKLSYNELFRLYSSKNLIHLFDKFIHNSS